MIHLTTERLIIRDPLPSDIDGWHRLMSDPNTMYYLQDIMTHSLDESRRNLETAIAESQSADRTKYFLSIEDRETGTFIGTTGYTVTQFTPTGKTAHVGYFILPEHHGKDVMTEALQEVVRFAFEEDGVYRIETGCITENHASERVMQKCGFIKEALRKACVWHDGRLKDRAEYRLLREEWQGMQKAKKDKPSFVYGTSNPAKLASIQNAIIPLEQKQWQDYTLPFHYISHHYYDVEIQSSDGAFHVSFVKKPFNTTFEHRPGDTDKLFKPHWDDVKAWGIVQDGQLLAAIETSVEEWSNRLRVTELWIDDAYRRQGIGTALMDIAMQRAGEEKRWALILETQSRNENAIAFYLAYGFTLIGFDACAYQNNDLARKEVRLELGILL